LLATFFVAVALDYFFMDPIRTLFFDRWEKAVGLTVFAAVALFLVEFGVARRRDERALQNSQEWGQSVFDLSPTMNFAVDPAGTILSVNSISAEKLGYTTEELLGQSVMTAFHEADRQAIQENIARCMQQPGRTITYELRRLRKDGTTLWVRETAKAVQLKKSQAVVLITCEDITERKRTEDAKLHLAAIVESSDDAIISKDLQGVMRSWNKAAERIFGYTAAEAVGQPVTMLIPPRLADEERQILEKIRRGESIDHYETVRLHKEGREINIALTVSPIRDDAGNIVGVSKTARDITERKRTEEALRKTQSELAHVNRVATLGELTASLAHEINQPLGAIVNNAGACLRWLAAHNIGEARQSTEHVIRDAHRASQIIKRIRSLMTKAPPQKDWMDINEIIGEVIAFLRPELHAERVGVQMQLSDELPTVLGDRIQLQQVLLNIVMNAIEAIRGAGEGPRTLVLRTDKHDAQHILVAVQDSGPGIDAGHLDQPFEAFYSTKPRGLGMGLAISRSIIEAHGGRLWATANESRGATFQFTLPIQSEKPA
jgi:PAS domain S-box-containing protein